MRQKIDSYTNGFQHIVIQCMIELGNDEKQCFNCGVAVTEKTREIQHLKYEGATIHDLRFGCHSCNMLSEYRNLI